MTLGNPLARQESRVECDAKLSDFTRQRLERDLLDLQRLIDIHFEERKQEETDLSDLRKRIDDRSIQRQQELKERARKQQERDRLKQIEAEKKAAEEERKRQAEEAKRKEAMEAMAMSMSMKSARNHQRKGKRALDRERKKKILTERRKPLNIDHLGREKLIEKAIEVHDWCTYLLTDKYDLEVRADFLQREVKQLRQRVNDCTQQKASRKLNLRK